MNGKVKAISVRTKGILYIPVNDIIGVRVAQNGDTIIDRECGSNLRVRESLETITSQIEALERSKTPVERSVSHHTTLSTSSNTVVLPQRGYRPADRVDSVVDMALGVGGGILLGDLIGGLFD